MAKDWDEIAELCTLCVEGKLYEVEAWIENDRPIQCEPPADRKQRKLKTPLQIAVKRGFYSLAELLLLNGYDPNGDASSSLRLAVEGKNVPMVDLLLEFGTDPQQVRLDTVLETCDRQIMDRFIAAGFDPCRDNAMAEALLFKARPLLGFIKQYCERFPGLMRQAAMALRYFVEERDVKGVALMLWVGANPHERVPGLFDQRRKESEEDWDCAFQVAAWKFDAPILNLILKVPIPPEQVQPLFEATGSACNPEITGRLLELGADPNRLTEDGHVLESMITRATWSYGFSNDKERQAGALECIRLVAEAGARWAPDPKSLASVRRNLTAGTPEVVSSIVRLFRENQVLTGEQLHELTRTPTMRRVLSGRGRPQKKPHDLYAAHYRPAMGAPAPAPTRSSYWKRPWSKW
jgi:hypothetical protein